MAAFRILLTAAGGPMAVETIRCLKNSSRHDIEVIGVDMNEDATARYLADHFMVVPSGKDPSYVEAIGKVVKRHSPDLVLPCSDEEAIALALARDAGMLADTQLACTSTDSLHIMRDKIKTFEMLGAHGVRVPKFDLAETTGALEELAKGYYDELGEFAVKPQEARGGRSVFVVRQDLKGTLAYNLDREIHSDWGDWQKSHATAAAEHLPVIIMERLIEPVFDIDALSMDGNIMRTFQRARINPAGIPFHGNISEDREDLEDLAQQVTDVLNLSWLYDYDVMSDRDGNPVVIEVNPRPSGSVSAAVACGVPILDDLVSVAKGEQLPEITKRRGVIVRPFTSIIEAHS